jgi:UDP-3-O-[3-hydroxymyristoyl] glucosamine N-acyltransferase
MSVNQQVNSTRRVGIGSIVDPVIKIGDGARIGPYSIIGYPPDDRSGVVPTLDSVIGDQTRIESFCVVELGVSIGRAVTIDHYVRVGANTKVGDNTYLLYGTRVHRNVIIGSNCRISGNCPDGTIIGDNVTHFGRIHHSYTKPTGGWEETDEPAPRVGAGSVIAAGAMLIGAIEIGEGCFIAAGEIVRRSVPSRSMYYRGEIIPGAQWTGRLAQSFFGKPRST